MSISYHEVDDLEHLDQVKEFVLADEAPTKGLLIQSFLKELQVARSVAGLLKSMADADQNFIKWTDDEWDCLWSSIRAAEAWGSAMIDGRRKMAESEIHRPSLRADAEKAPLSFRYEPSCLSDVEGFFDAIDESEVTITESNRFGVYRVTGVVCAPLNGGTKLQLRVTCENCDGGGSYYDPDDEDEEEPIECPACDGDGQINSDFIEYANIVAVQVL